MNSSRPQPLREGSIPTIGDDSSVPKSNDSIREPGDFVGMRNHHDGEAVRAIQLQKDAHDLGAGVRIELSSGFVGQKNFRFVDERPCDRYPLLLPAGKLGRQAMFFSGQADQSQHTPGLLVGISGVAALIQQG
jgi:hypothetical protein